MNNYNFRTRSLFFETRRKEDNCEEKIKYTLKDHDYHEYPSLYRLYMEMEDTTEWDFACTYMDSYAHWMHLCSISWFRKYITRWRHELQQKLKARALQKIKAVADADDKDSYAANKYLLTQLDPPTAPGRGAGRPSKEAIEKEARKLVDINDTFKSDIERMKEFDSRLTKELTNE